MSRVRLVGFTLPDVKVELDHRAVGPVTEAANEIATMDARDRRLSPHNTLSSGARRSASAAFASNSDGDDVRIFRRMERRFRRISFWDSGSSK